MIDRTRRGSFYIDELFIEDHPDQVRKLMAQMIIVRCEHIFSNRHFQYDAISSVFAAVPEGCFTPKYRLVYDHSKDELSIEKCEADEYAASMKHIHFGESND